MEPVDKEKIREAVRERYARVSSCADGHFEYPTGAQAILSLGYDPAVIAGIPPAVLASYCGIGNPFSLGAIEPGSKVLDLGCGTGFDVLVASGMVGEAGRVVGLDLTPEMVEQARSNMELAGVRNAEIAAVEGEAIPFDDSSFDVIISNGVINLSPDKERSFSELYRVLRPGGRLQFADIVLRSDLPEEKVGSLEAWSQ